MQIVHEPIRKHWVLISLIDCNENTIEVYDSFFKTVTPTTVSTICQILQPNPGSISNIKLVNTKRQRRPNASDCGVLVCAFVGSLLRGRRPVGVVYDIPRMRQHLAVCLESSTLTAFPAQCQRSRAARCMFGRTKHTFFACVANLGRENSRLSAVVAMYTVTQIVCIYRLSALPS